MYTREEKSYQENLLFVNYKAISNFFYTFFTFFVKSFLKRSEYVFIKGFQCQTCGHQVILRNDPGGVVKYTKRA